MFAILGATGKAGRASIKRLRAADKPVRAVMRDAARAEEFIAMGCETAIADHRDAASLRAALAGATAVQAIIPMSVAVEDAVADMDAMIDNVAAAIEDARPETVLAISDYGAQNPTGTGLTLTFHRIEQRFGALSANLIFLRSAEHMQNWARQFAIAAKSGVMTTLHHPLTKIFPTVSAADVGDAGAELLMAPQSSSPRIVHIEGPRRYTPLEIANAASAALGRAIEMRELPRDQWLQTFAHAGMSASYAKLVEELYDTHNAGGIEVEEGGEARRGATELADVFASLAAAVSRA